MNSDKLRREIESLLKGYYRFSLDPSPAREPVLGALGISRSVLRETGNPIPNPDYLGSVDGWWRYTGLSEGNRFDSLYPRIESAYGPWESSSVLAAQMTGERLPCNTFANEGKSVLYNRGSMYSGRMREVVQLLGGRSWPIPYSPEWCKTHGIYVTADDVWWVVEISAQGVFAWPLPYSSEYTEEEKTSLGITIPVRPSRDTQLANSANARTLLTGAGMADFYSGAWPYYEEHGWAFSYTGHSAYAIAITLDGVDQRATVWKITISADEAGNPVSAALLQVETSYLWAARTVAPKYPVISECGMSLLSYDTSATTAAPSGSVNFAMDVYFIPSSVTPVIIRHNLNSAGVGITNEPANMPATSGSCYDFMFANKSSVGEHSSVGWTHEVRETPEYDFSGIGRPCAINMRFLDTLPGNITNFELEKKGDYVYYNGGSSSRYVWSEWYEAKGTKYAGGTRQQLYDEIFFKPSWDREACGIAQRKKLSKSYGSWVTYIDRCVASGTRWGGVSGLNGSPPYYVYKYADTTCGTTFASTDLSGALEYNHAFNPMSNWDVITVPAVSVCPGNVRYMLNGNLDGSLYNVHCQLYDSGSSYSNTSNAATNVYLHVSGGWKQVHSESSWRESGLFDFVADCNSGSITFGAFIDVFTGAGVTHKWPNESDVYVVGSVGEYPISDPAPADFAGWVGVPMFDGAL